jgi:hypothetical protein
MSRKALNRHHRDICIVALTLQNVPPATTNVITTSVTASAPGQTSTSVSKVTASAAVAVIFIIATGFLAMRGRKPGS